MKKRHMIATGVAAAVLLVGGGTVASATAMNGPLPQAPSTSDGPDVPGQPDLPEPGDTPDPTPSPAPPAP